MGCECVSVLSSMLRWHHSPPRAIRGLWQPGWAAFFGILDMSSVYCLLTSCSAFIIPIAWQPASKCLGLWINVKTSRPRVPRHRSTFSQIAVCHPHICFCWHGVIWEQKKLYHKGFFFHLAVKWFMQGGFTLWRISYWGGKMVNCNTLKWGLYKPVCDAFFFYNDTHFFVVKAFHCTRLMKSVWVRHLHCIVYIVMTSGSKKTTKKLFYALMNRNVGKKIIIVSFSGHHIVLFCHSN